MSNNLTLKKNIDGIILLNKPKDLSSNAVLQKVKRIFKAKKAGHTGSLDPMATGMLPICFGEATKISQFLLDADKCYEVEGCFGSKTNTGDAMGEIVAQNNNFSISKLELNTILSSFIGNISQIPPMFSALKYQGQPLYKFARKGIDIERKRRDIMIYDIKLDSFEGKYFNLTVFCSKGTYVRTLIEDIGEKLGTYAHVTKLNRTYTAGFADEKMYTLVELESKAESELTQILLPADRAILGLRQVILSPLEVLEIFQGKVIHSTIPSEQYIGLVRIYSGEMRFLGVGEINEEGWLKSKRLFIGNAASFC
ncbi:MAG: tRNA pseudouridine(55) synthase TruB [Legionellales bacterium RIFCSPHIGHO2_12_FULL_35_11]|nr:MAG: tRNA pseudouridine(55) synthase TruB [Legionellales bacterium RIFCSPHIGHO2_12_FULL_35_11]